MRALPRVTEPAGHVADGQRGEVPERAQAQPVQQCGQVLDSRVLALIKTERGIVRLLATQMYTQLRGDPASPLTISQTAGQSSNTTVRVGEMFFLKFYRRLQSGINPELEMGRVFWQKTTFHQLPPLAGYVREGFALLKSKV